MSISTPPPGPGPKGDGGARPAAGAPSFTTAGGVAGASGVTPTTPIATPGAAVPGATLSPAAAALVQPGTLDGPGALRVLVEEIRAVVQTQLRSASSPPLPLPDNAADPGNAAATLLRWLRTAAADSGVPLARLSGAVDTGYARAAAALAATPGGERLVRETLGAARDVVLRGIASGADAARAAASALPRDSQPVREPSGAAGSGGASAAGPRGGETPGRVDAIGRDTRAPLARGALPAADVPGGRTPARGPLPAALTGELAARAGADVRGAAPPTSSAELVRALGAAVRSSPGDPAGALRRFAEQLTAGAGARGSAWLPPAEVDIVDPGASLVRWVRTAAALPGASPDALRATIANAHGRTLERLATAPAAAALRELVGLARDLLVRELGGPPPPATAAPSASLLPATALAEPEAHPAALRPELVLGGPQRAGRVAAHATRGRSDERVDAVGAEERRRDREQAAAADEPADEAADARPAGDVDLQGPMDCIRRYFDAFHAGDSAAYAAQWVYPACFWAGARWSAYADAAACIEGNSAHERAAREQGMTGGRILMLRVEPLTPAVAIVHGVFTRERADGSVLAEIEAAYTTVKTDAGWKVAVCVVK